MHFVARVQPSLDFLARISTLLMRMPSERQDNEGGKERVKREERGNEESDRQQER